MNVYSFSKRSIFPQSGLFSYQLGVSLNTTVGSCELGFSGDTKLFSFNIISGKVYDQEGNFIFGISSNETFTLSGNVNQSQHDYYFNGLPTRISGAKQTGYAKWFYVNPVNCSSNINLYVNGEKPSAGFTNTFYSGTSITGTGFITNFSSLPMRVFSGESLDSDWRFNFPSGEFLNSLSYSGFKNNINVASSLSFDTVNCKIYTNFGTFTTGLIQQTQYEVSQNLYPQIFSLLSSGEYQGQLAWQNLLGSSSYNDAPINVQFYVRWSSGFSSGDFQGAWSMYTGLEDGSQLLSVPYFSGITGFSGRFDSFGFGSRYLLLQKFTTGQDILEFFATGLGGFRTYLTGV